MGNAAEKLDLTQQRIDNAKGKVILNLGCGDKLWDEAINCDMANNYANVQPDVTCDITKLPFPDEYADEVHAIHVLEHFYFTEVEGIINEWKRVLKPGGYLCLEVPCLEKILINFQNQELSKSKNYYQMTWLGLYGDQIPDHPEMIHKWCYSTTLLMQILKMQGFSEVEFTEPMFHLVQRDMRVTGRK